MIGALAHESNDFCQYLTTRDMFEYYEGNEVLEHLPVCDIFEDAGIEVVPSIFAVARNYGPVDKAAYMYFEKKILNTLRQNSDIDGVWMFCHGAMNVKNMGSGEYRLSQKMREIVGEKCVISFGMDLHGNIEPGLKDFVNIIRCYHTAPHIDQPETYRLTAETLVHYLKNDYHCFPQLRKLSMIFPGEMASTTVDPFKTIVKRLDDLEHNDEKVACASLFIGFAWTDAPRTASTVVVVPSAPEYEKYCSELTDELAEYIFGKRREFHFQKLSLSPTETVKQSLYEMEPPVCVTDMGDNPDAGAIGGSVVLLKEYMKMLGDGFGLKTARGSAKRVLIVGIYDPKAFERCKAHKVGDKFDLPIGIDIDEVTRPVKVHVIYRGWHEVLGYNFRTNPPIKRCEGVTVTTGNIDIVIVNKGYHFTQHVNFESCDLNPANYDVFVTKFGYIYPELEEMGKSFIMSNTPGESCQTIKDFHFTNLVRPIYPVDEI